MGGERKEKEVVEKVQRTLPTRYSPKVSTIEDQDDLELLTLDEPHVIFTSYEMRTRQNEPTRKEAAFNATKESKKSEVLPKNHSDDEEALFIKKLEIGTIKYK